MSISRKYGSFCCWDGHSRVRTIELVSTVVCGSEDDTLLLTLIN